MHNSPIFVVGTPRSGTTLMAKILGAHSAIFMPGETHFFPSIYAQRGRLGDLNRPQSIREAVSLILSLYKKFNEPSDQARVFELIEKNPEFERKLLGCRSYRELFSTFMQEQAEYEGKERWGNNVPKDIFHINDILRFYPDAKIIICIRDVRAFLLSYQGKWRVTAEEQVERLKKLYHPVMTSLLWKSSMRLMPNIRAVVKAENLMIVPYEELVKEADAVVPKVCHILGQSFEPSMLDITTNNSSYSVAARGIFDVSVSKWKTVLSAEEIWIGQTIAKKELEELGYDIVPVSPNYLKLVAIFLGAPLAVIRAVNANKHMRGPIIPYLRSRISSIISRS